KLFYLYFGDNGKSCGCEKWKNNSTLEGVFILKKPFYYLLGLTIFLISFAFTNTSRADASNALIPIDTSIVPDSYELEVLVNKNDPNNEDLTVFVDNHKYNVVDGKLVEDFIPTFSTYAATDSKTITLANGIGSTWKKIASAGTTVHTGSTGVAQKREHKIYNAAETVLSSITGSAGSIGCQKTVTSKGTYAFTIQNLSGKAQTWNWSVTF
uniref:hypothetical protein n=1 Tax=Streptomyces atratus TaxID=1893 RepID=UPI0036D41202